MAVVPQSRPPAKLRALDPDLPFLASKAAIELDNCLAGKPAGLESVRKLVDLLQNSLVPAGSSGGLQSLMDPATVAVLGRALDQSESGESVTTVEQLASRAGEIADNLSQSGSSSPSTSSLEWSRAFCVALSRGAAACRQSIQDLQPPHPYRR